MNKKRIVLSLFLCVLLFSFAGCSSNKNQENNKTAKVTSVDDLSGSKIGVQIGTTGDIYASDMEDDGSGTVVEKYNKGSDAIQALKQNKIDCVIIDAEPAKALVEKNRDLKILSEEFAVEDYAICISKDNSDLKDKINAALKELQEDGTLDMIKKNYTGTDAELGNYP